MAGIVRRTVQLPAYAVSLVIALAACASQDDSDQRIREAADALLQDLHDRGLFNGAVVLGRAGEEVYARGFGPANVEAGVPFTPDTPSDGGSMAKTLVAASILTLQDEGRLRLDDPVRKYVPEYPHATTQVGHLIAHSAGLSRRLLEIVWPFLPRGEVITTTDFIQALGEQGVEPDFEPGTRFSYCNLCYDVAALVVERVTGIRWNDFLRERVFDTLGMDATFIRPGRLADWPGVRTLSYRHVGDRLEVFDVPDNWGFYGGANLYFSTRDLYRWSRSFYTRPVLNSTVLATGREAPLIRSPKTGDGGRSAINLLSWVYSTDGGRYHYSGFSQGFRSSVYRDEDRRHSAVYMTNDDTPVWLWLLLMRALIDIMEGRAPATLDRPQYVELDSQNVDAIPGTFSVPGIGTVTIDAPDGQAAQDPSPFTAVASLRVDSGLEHDVVFVGEGQMFVPGIGVLIGFPNTPIEPFRYVDWVSVFDVAEGERTRSSTAP